VILRPANKDELARALRAASQQTARIERVDLGALDRLLQHTPEDMTVTVEAGVTLAGLQAALARQGQWLPVDPPNPESLTMAALLSTNASGPRRFGFGTIRDHLIGLQVALADGRLVRSGGKVVKNVAGYDLMKLFVGSRDSLGLIVEATFKLLPLPEAERFVQVPCDSPEEAGSILDRVFESELTPVVLDLHNGSAAPPARGRHHLILGFSGTSEDVAWQVAQAATLGIAAPATLDDEQHFWSSRLGEPHHLSVLPSRLVETLRHLGEVPYLARAGNGIIYHWTGTPPSKADRPDKLLRRLKDTFDPKHTLPELPA